MMVKAFMAWLLFVPLVMGIYQVLRSLTPWSADTCAHLAVPLTFGLLWLLAEVESYFSTENLQ